MVSLDPPKSGLEHNAWIDTIIVGIYISLIWFHNIHLKVGWNIWYMN